MTEINSEKKSRKIFYYFLMYSAFLIYSVSGIISKFAGEQKFLSWEFIGLMALLIVDLGIYAILWQQVLKKLPLSVAYSNKSITILFGFLWGALLFGEVITWQMGIGAAVVIAGMILMVSDG